MKATNADPSYQRGAREIGALAEEALDEAGSRLRFDAHRKTTRHPRLRHLKEGHGPPVYVVNGWLTEGSRKSERDWLPCLQTFYRENPWYVVRWKSGLPTDWTAPSTALNAISMGTAVASSAREVGVRFLWGASARALSIGSYLGTPIAIVAFAWASALRESKSSGALLARLIAESPSQERPVLLGHSLGARLIVFCLQVLESTGCRRVETVHLMGGAIGTGQLETWVPAERAVTQRIHNYYSKHDTILKILHSPDRGLIKTPAIGCSPIPWHLPKIVNHDVSEWVPGHNKYKKQSVNFLVK